MSEKCANVKRLEFLLARKEARIRELEEQLDHAAYSLVLLAKQDEQKGSELRAANKLADRLELDLAVCRDGCGPE